MRRVYLMFAVLPLFLLVYLVRMNLQAVGAQYVPEAARQAPINVSIQGWIGDIIVSYVPVNFTDPLSTEGVDPGVEYPKFNADGVGYIKVETNGSNVAWEIWMNASNLVGIKEGRVIAPGNISVWSDCNGTNPAPANISLSEDLQAICDSNYPIPRNGSALIYFYLFVPVGMRNDTYFGNFTIYLNSTEAANNVSWDGVDQTTVIVRRHIEISWNIPLGYITFGPTPGAPLSPGTYNATPGAGWPANLSSNANTNIDIDFYVNGTHLTCADPGSCGSEQVLSHNITYSNATSEQTWPDSVKTLEIYLPANPTSWGGDFPNWGLVPPATEIPTWWNITIVPGITPGPYSGYVNAKAVDHGADPTPAG